MAILKSPPKPPKNETLQIRIEEATKTKLERYAQFIEASESYVVSEALKLLFRKDNEFNVWLESQGNHDEGAHGSEASLFDATEESVRSNDGGRQAMDMPQKSRPQW